MNLPKILETGRTPTQWVEIFAEQGVELSERTLREKARALNAYCAVGNAMLLKPEHIDIIFEDLSCRSKCTNEAKHGGSADELMGLTTTLDEALEHLQKPSPKRKSTTSKGKRGNVRYLDRMRRNQSKKSPLGTL
ncbi:hypothetical protein [Roseibium album]|uniref:hypothetical protein n=1 Tax=Roseibium album TaxID=311410 RepID=UPI00391C3D8D